MTPLFKKLNYKGGPVVCLHAPDSFAPELDALRAVAEVHTDDAGITHFSFVLIFVCCQSDIDRTIGRIGRRLQGDAILWYAYPKGTSKRYRCDFNRDTGWAPLGDFELEAVRQVAIDEDWSALRFRKQAFIRKLSRNQTRALSAAAKMRLPG